MGDTELTDISEKVKEFAEVSKVIKITQEKLKILNKKKQILYKEVMPKLKSSNVTKCNLPFGTLKVSKTKRKITPTKVTLKEKYISFFNTRAIEQDYSTGTPDEKATIVYNYIYVDNIEFKEEHSITMTYSKELTSSLYTTN